MTVRLFIQPPNRQSSLHKPLLELPDSGIRSLIGEDVTTEDFGSVDLGGLAVAFDPAAVTARPHEIGGLDIEIGRLLLDRENDSSRDLAHLSEVWVRNPNAHLQIHPLLEEIRVWGSRLPVSAVRTAQKRLSDMGLEICRGAMNPEDLSAVRATGGRFHLGPGTPVERIQCLRDALAVGGGYVELADAEQRVLGSVRRRHVDLESLPPAVAPLFAGSASLSRSHAAGRCPCCAGNGSVTTIDEEIYISQPTADPLGASFLRAEALGVLRGGSKEQFAAVFQTNDF